MEMRIFIIEEKVISKETFFFFHHKVTHPALKGDHTTIIIPPKVSLENELYSGWNHGSTIDLTLQRRKKIMASKVGFTKLTVMEVNRVGLWSSLLKCISSNTNWNEFKVHRWFMVQMDGYAIRFIYM